MKLISKNNFIISKDGYALDFGFYYDLFEKDEDIYLVIVKEELKGNILVKECYDLIDVENFVNKFKDKIQQLINLEEEILKI